MNTDSHTDTQIGCFTYAQELMKEIDFPEELVVNRSVAEVRKFIDKKNL